MPAAPGGAGLAPLAPGGGHALRGAPRGAAAPRRPQAAPPRHALPALAPGGGPSRRPLRAGRGLLRRLVGLVQWEVADIASAVRYAWYRLQEAVLLLLAARSAAAQRRATRLRVGREDQAPSDVRQENATVLTDKVCMIPGDKPVVRVEDAPGNARRIFTGVDIRATVDDVWNVMTDYVNLQKVVPNLQANDLLEPLDGGGARLWQIGRSSWQIFGKKFYFQAGTTLDVRLHPTGMCNSGVRAAGERIDAAQMSSDDVRKYGKGLKLVRDVFPRPFSIAADGVAIRDITMQNVEGAKSDFVHYQGVWRLQPLDGCAAPGENMMRLTFAVECEPHWFLPVAPVEGRIAEALVENMEAIRAHVEATVQSRAQAAAAAGVASPASAAAPVQAAAPAKEKTLWDQAAEWVAENAPQAPAGAPQWVPFSLDGLPRRALRRRGAPLAGARLRFGAGPGRGRRGGRGALVRCTPRPAGPVAAAAAAYSAAEAAALAEAMTGALARTEATLGALEPLGAGLEAGAGAAGLVDVLAAAVAVEGLAPQVLMGAAVAAIAAWSGSTRQSGNQGVAEAGWAGGDDDLKRAWLAVLEQHPEAVVQKEFLGVPFERDMLKRRLNRFARLLGISVAQAVPIIEVDATPLLVESADISEVLGRLATITSVEKARELVSKNPTLVAGRAADRKKEDGLAVSAIVDILYAGRLQKVLEDGGKDTRGKIAEIELYSCILQSLKPLADVAFRGLTAGNAAAATRRLFRALQQVVPNESIRVLLGRVAEAERPWEYLVEQTTAGLSMARGLVQRPSMTTPIVNYWTPIMMHLPSIYTRLSILRPHVPAIVRILDPYFEIVEPYLDRIMERMDRIEPHLPYILLHLDVLAKHCGPLLDHFDTLIPYAENKYTLGRREGVAQCFTAPEEQIEQCVMANWDDGQEDYELSEGSKTYLPKLLPYVDVLVPQLDELAPHLPLVHPHLPHILPYMDNLLPIIPRFVKYPDASRNADVLIGYLGWILRLPFLPQILAIPRVPWLIAKLSTILPRRPIRGMLERRRLQREEAERLAFLSASLEERRSTALAPA